MDDNEKPKGMGKVIQIDEARIRDHLGEMVRGTVEEALNAMLDAEPDRLCGAGRYERSEGRKDIPVALRSASRVQAPRPLPGASGHVLASPRPSIRAFPISRILYQ